MDGCPVKSMRFPNTPLVKGDARSYSIAGASVLAKVTRDRLMREFDRLYPGYGFAEHIRATGRRSTWPPFRPWAPALSIAAASLHSARWRRSWSCSLPDLRPFFRSTTARLSARLSAPSVFSASA